MAKVDKNTTFDFSEEDEVRVESNFWKPNVNDFVVGIVEELRTGQYGEEVILTQQNGEKIVLGSYTSLKGKITSEDKGKAVKVQRVADEKSDAGRLYFNFKVWKKN